MSNQKNIDRLFQEKLQGFERQPRPEVWEQIQQQMQPKKKKRRIVWWFYGTAAAVLILAFLLWFPKESPNNFPVDSVVITVPDTEKNTDTLPKQNRKNPKTLEQTPIQITKNPENKERQQIIKQNKKPVENLITETAIAQTTEKEVENTSKENTQDFSETNPDQNQHSLFNKEYVNKKNEKNKKSADSIPEQTKMKDSLPSKSTNQKKKELYTQLEEDPVVDKKKQKKWSLRPLVAFSTIAGSSGSPTDEVFSNNPTSGNGQFNYGLSLSYQVNPKLSLQTGILTQNISFNTERVTLSNSANTVNDLPNIVFTESLSFVLSGFGSGVALSDVSNNANILDANAQLNQRIRYLEIPVEAKYQILSSGGLQTSFIGGFSSLFLQDNEILLASDVVGTRAIGTSSNLNSVNFSGNFGLDFDYQINSHLFLNINPMVKVHLNTFTRETSNSLPLFLGVYSGVKYQF